MMASPRGVRIAERVLLVGGVVLLIFLVRRLGAATVADNVRLVGWGIVPIILQEIGAHLANTLGWRMAFPRPRPPIPFPQLVAARIAGDAVNYVTPTATLGGEFARTRFLDGRAETRPLVASVAVAKLSQLLGQIGFVVVGLAIVLGRTPLPSAVRHALWAGLGASMAAAAALVVLQRRGMFAPLWGLARRLGVPAGAPGFGRRMLRLDAEIARFHGTALGAFVLSAAWFFVGWTWGVVDTYVTLWFLGVPVTIQRALTVEVLSVAIDGMFFFVPGKVGTQEGGKVLIFTVLGLDPAMGLSMGILRRIRELTWALVGLLLLSRRQQAVARTSQPAAR